MIAVARVAGFDLSSRLALISSALAYAFAWRARKEAGGRVLDVATWPATLFLLAGLHALLPAWAVSPAWALAALALAEFDRRSLRAQAFLVSAVVATRCLVIDLSTLPTRSRHRTHHRLFLGRNAAPRTRQPASLIQFSARHHSARRAHLPRSHRQPAHRRLGCSKPSFCWPRASPCAIACSASPASHLFLICTLKLFFWDLRNLETLPRIISFIVLGLLLVTVSWVYTRFRDQVQRFL